MSISSLSSKPESIQFCFHETSLISKNSLQLNAYSLSPPNSFLLPLIQFIPPATMSHHDYLNNLAGRSISNAQNSYRSPLAGFLADSLRRPDVTGKRSLAEHQQQAAFFLRNVKHRPHVEFPTSPELSSVSNISSSYGVPVIQHPRPNPQGFGYLQNHNSYLWAKESLTRSQVTETETEGKMMKRLQELEKELLLDDVDEHDVSGVTNSDWSETIQTIFTSAPVAKPDNVISPVATSPTSSSSSSCASSSVAPICPTQLFSDAAAAISDGKPDSAVDILTRLNHCSNARGAPDQRLCFYMTLALRSRLNTNTNAGKNDSSELYGKDHILSTQLLYEKSPCFKQALVTANATILEVVEKKKLLHVVDFDIGQGVQYVYLLHAIVSFGTSVSLKLTTFSDFGNGDRDRLKLVGESLKSVAKQLGVSFSFHVSGVKLPDLTRAALMMKPEEVLVVNLAFKLYKLPDESVTTENVRDEVLRRVKGLWPAVVTVVEQELNGNTAAFESRVGQVCGYYGALMESLEATMGRDEWERVKIEEGLSRKMVNSVACEGVYRVERCEVFGKWRARMRMAGFSPKLTTADSSVTSGNRNPGFTVKEDGGGVCFGWMGRTLTVASAWH